MDDPPSTPTPPAGGPAFIVHLPPSSYLSSSPTSVAAANVITIDRNPQDIDSKCTDDSHHSLDHPDDDDDHVSVDLEDGGKPPLHSRSDRFDDDEDPEGGLPPRSGSSDDRTGRNNGPAPTERTNDDGVEEDDDDDDGPSRRTIAFWLIAWLVNNVMLTLLNKATFARFDFSYPFFLSFFHMLCNYVGAEVWFTYLEWSDRRRRRRGRTTRGGLESSSVHDAKYHAVHGYRRAKSVLMDEMVRSELDRNGLVKTYAFSVIFSLNIAIGNVSLRYVSVNFNQVMRSLVPVVAILLGGCLGKRTSARRKFAVVPIMLGVAMACFGDFSITTIGFVFTCLCVVLAALKAVAAGEILTGELKLHPVDLLYKMAPKAAVQCLLLSLATGEVHSIASRWSTELSPSVSLWPLFGVVSTGILSFSLNISSLISNKLTSPLTLCIAANVKQVLMIVLATIMFNIHISPLNGSGILVVLVGSAVYSYISMQEKTVGKACVAPSAKRVSEAEETDGLSVSSSEEEGVSLIDARR